MIKIFQVKPDANNCQWAMPSDRYFTRNGGLNFNGTPKLPNWNPPEFYIHNPILPKCDFYIIGSGCFAFNETILDNLNAMKRGQGANLDRMQ